MNLSYIGDGKVVLIAGGGRVYTDIAARFVRSEKSLDDILGSPYDKKIVKNILDAGHLAATEFDYFIFGVEGYSRVCETQLVRKRIASYLIKSGRPDKLGNRSFDMVLPKSIFDFRIYYELPYSSGTICVGAEDILKIIEQWYNVGVALGYREEDLRYLKPQATEFKAIIGMNAHALLDWFKIRCCLNAQDEIRDMANKMLKLCKEAVPDLFRKAGANCAVLGYCPENGFQNEKCKGKIKTHKEVLELLGRGDFV